MRVVGPRSSQGGVCSTGQLVVLGGPVVVGGGDGGELERDHLADGDQAVGVGGVDGSARDEDVEVGLDVVDAVPSQGEGQRSALLGGRGDQGSAGHEHQFAVGHTVHDFSW